MPAGRLTSDLDLADYPGAPFPASVVLSVEADVRGEAGWHIAPEYRETVVVYGTGSSWLFLPSLRLVTVHSVLDPDAATVDPADYRVRPGGELEHLDGVWTDGDAYTIDVTHGFATAADLTPVVASRCQRAAADTTLVQSSEHVGERTITEAYNVNRLDGEVVSPALGRYSLRVFS